MWMQTDALHASVPHSQGKIQHQLQSYENKSRSSRETMARQL